MRASSGPRKVRGGDVGMKKQSWHLCLGCTGAKGSCCCGGTQDAKGIVCQASSPGVKLEPVPQGGVWLRSWAYLELGVTFSN
jgi:hypothetical protein